MVEGLTPGEPSKADSGRFLIIPREIATRVMRSLIEDDDISAIELPDVLTKLITALVPPQHEDGAFRGAEYFERCALEWQASTGVELVEPSVALTDQLVHTYKTSLRIIPRPLIWSMNSEDVSAEEYEQYNKRLKEIIEEQAPEEVIPVGYSQAEKEQMTPTEIRDYTNLLEFALRIDEVDVGFSFGVSMAHQLRQRQLTVERLHKQFGDM